MSLAVIDETWNNLIPSMFLDPTFSDVTIVVSDQHFPAHKIILGLKSSVFKAMFECDMNESKTHKVHIVDFSAEAVKTMLHCIYDPSVLSRTIDNIGYESLLYLAGKYGVDSITKKAGSYLIMNMHNFDVVDVLICAHRLKNQNIKNAAFKEFFQTSSDVFKTENLLGVLGPDLCAELFAFIDQNVVGSVASNVATSGQEKRMPSLKPRVSLGGSFC